MSFLPLEYGTAPNGYAGLTSTGTTQADALPLPSQINQFSTVTNNSGCVLPRVNATITVINNGLGTLLVYPSKGGQIDSGGTDSPFSLATGSQITLSCVDNLIYGGTHIWRQIGSSSGTGQFVPVSGGTMTGPLVLVGDAAAPLQPVTLQQLTGTMNANFAAPPPIGNTTANTGSFTTLTATGGTLQGITAGGTTPFQSIISRRFSAISTNTTFSTAAASAWFYGNAPFVGTTTESDTAFNLFQFNDNVVSNATTSLVSGLKVLQQLTSTSLRGSRIAINAKMRITTKTANSGANPGGFYVANQGDSFASVNDGGVLGNEYGSLVGAEFSGQLGTGATNWATLYGLEIGSGIQTGASAFRRSGVSIEEIVNSPNRAYGGYGTDNALQFVGDAATTAPGWGIGVAFGHAAHQSPFRSDSVYIASVPISLNNRYGPLVADTGIRFWQTYFTTAALQLPGLSVDNVGNLLLANATIGRAAGGISIDVPRLAVTAAAIAAPGAAYTANDLVYEATSRTVMRVASVDGSGHITGLTLLVAGSLMSAPGGPLALTGGTGDGLATVTLTTAANNTLFLQSSGGAIVLPTLTNAVNDAAAASAGVALNQLYRNGSVVMQRIT